MIYTEAMQDRRVQIVDVNRIACDVVTEIIRFAERNAGLDAAAC